MKATGRLDVWANVAGIIRNTLIVDATPEDVEAVTRVNLWGTYWGIAAAGRAMKKGGSIVNVSSAGGEMPAPDAVDLRHDQGGGVAPHPLRGDRARAPRRSG